MTWEEIARREEERQAEEARQVAAKQALEAHLKEEQLAREAAQKQAEIAAMVARESPKLMRALEIFKIRKLLETMRDEIWKTGEVNTKVTGTSKYDLAVSISLEVNWDSYIPGYYTEGYEGENSYSIPPEWVDGENAITRHELRIGAEFEIGESSANDAKRVATDNVRLSLYADGDCIEHIKADDPQAKQNLERALAKDILRRRSKDDDFPYDQTKKRADKKFGSVRFDLDKKEKKKHWWQRK